ncbi:hypothetical protein VH86_03060 [Pantoea sp. BL1]|uniref:hypothetical protein n=1 Tax=Pantoea sp. BL1 TaxID=1628190 RepID=UPI0005F889E0|nr:hypothetical protein [Pantoea sp. BL1]KJV50156.1 hypothetical protein VH86_03060 [Pantoea sp. BL1]
MVGRKLYAYLNINNPMVAWEVAIGRIESICNDGNEFGVSIWHYNLLKNYLSGSRIIESRNEYELELIRMLHFPEKVSRLKGVYFFESREMAECALERWRLKPLSRFITEVEFFGDNYTNVDSEWITTYLNVEEDIHSDWMKKYWSGETMGVRPLTEVLASGVGLVHDKTFRSEAIRSVYEQWPTSSILLNASIAGFAICHLREISRVKPSVMLKNGKMIGQYYIDMNSLNDNERMVANAMVKMFKEGSNLVNIKPDNEEHVFSLPDFRSEFFESNDEIMKHLFKNVHSL